MSGRRIYGSWGIEHVVLKGNNGMKIFDNDEDCRYFMNLLRSKQESSTSLISYALMNNHVHLILKEDSPEKISNLIMKVAGHYSYWYNTKYKRENALFRRPFYNESIEEETHLLNAIHYVHNNPVKAKIVSHPQNYRWSSYNEYKGKSVYIDKEVFNQYFHENDYIFDKSQIHPKKNNSESYYRSIEYADTCLKEYLKKKNITNILHLTREERNDLIKALVTQMDVNCESIADILVLSRSQVRRILHS